MVALQLALDYHVTCFPMPVFLTDQTEKKFSLQMVDETSPSLDI